MLLKDLYRLFIGGSPEAASPTHVSYLICSPGTEHDILNTTRPGLYGAQFNLKHLVNGDTVCLRVYLNLPGARGIYAPQLFAAYTVENSQEEPAKALPEVYCTAGLRITLEQTSGEGRPVGFAWYRR